MFNKKNEEGGVELSRFGKFFSLNQSTTSQLTSSGMDNLYKAGRQEIIDCIDAISKLVPLIPNFLTYGSKDLSTAAMVVSIKHSLRGLPEELQRDRRKIEQLRLLYSKWIQSLFITYNINKEVVKSLIRKIKLYLDRVCD